MATLLGEQIYLSSKELQGYGFSLGTIKNEFDSIPNPNDSRYSLYSYDGIAVRSKKSASKLPSKASILLDIEAKKVSVVQNETQQIVAKLPTLWACEYKVNDVNYYIGKGYSHERSTKLAQSMAIMRFANKTRLPKQLLKQVTGFSKREELLKAICSLLADMDVPAIPTNYDRLRTKCDAFDRYLADKRNKDLDFLISKKDNHNAQVIGKPYNTHTDNILAGGRINVSEWHANTILVLAMNPGQANKFDREEVYVRYLRACASAEKDPQSLSSLKRFLNLEEVKLMVTWERDGFTQFDKLLPHVHGRRPSFALRKGGCDGFQVDFLTDDTNTYVMLTCVAVFDYYSEAITGFDIGYTETGLLVRNAYRNHLRLHGGRTYFEMDMDGSMANLSTKTKEMFDRVVSHVRVGMGDDPTYKHRSNSKERFSERLIQELNRLTQNVDGWKGTNVTSHNVKRKPNPDYAKKHHKTLQAGIAQIVDLVNVYNNVALTKYNGKSRLSYMESNIDTETEVIDSITQNQLFNWRTVVQVYGDLIKISVNKTTYEYFVPDPLAWVAKMDRGHKVAVYYDEDAMQEVHVFGWGLDENNNATESFLGVLQLGVRAFKDKRSQTEEDTAIIATQVGKRKAMINSTLRKMLEVEAVAYGIDASMYKDTKDLQKVILGMRNKETLVENFADRYATELNTDNAIATRKFYEDAYAERNIRIAETVVVEKDATKEAIKYKKYDLNKFND